MMKRVLISASKLDLEKHGSFNDSQEDTQLKPEKLILWASVATVLGLIQLPYTTINGNPVPTLIFKDSPCFFHGFLLSLNFSFFGSFMTLHTRETLPRLAKSCLFLAAASTAVGLAILGWLLALPWIRIAVLRPTAI